MKRAMLFVAAIALVGCPKKPSADADAGVTATTSASAMATGVILGGDKPTDAGAAAKAPAAATETTWTGKYTVSAGTMYVPENKDWSSVKFKNDDTKLLGDGEIKLSVDPSGRVSGSTEAGPLGASIIEGMSENGALNATIRRKDLADLGLTGTLVAKITGDALEGTMNLAEANAAVVRIGKVDAKQKK